jgi:hypothetical protein
MSSTVRDVDRGYKDLVARVFSAAQRSPQIDVGVLEGPGSQPDGDGSIRIIEVAVFNEFGTATIPERSFIRAWFDENEAGLRQDLVKLMQSVIRGQRTADQVLELLGQRCVGQIQERMAAGIDPENAPSTIARKGSSTPLIDTGALRSSISYRVER